MIVKQVDAVVRHLCLDSHYLVYSSIIGLASLDVMTTYTASVVMGQYFAEVGLIASTLMKIAPDVWPLSMFIVESLMFGILAFFLSRGRNNTSTLNVLRWKLRLGYLPSLALLILVLNNTILVIIFAVPIIQ